MAIVFFGIFPFPRASCIPYDIRPSTLEKRTSTLQICIYEVSLSSETRSVKPFLHIF